MCTDWSRPLMELANCVIVPLAKCVGMWCYDLLCYRKVIKELESVASTLKGVHADIQGTVNAAKNQGQVVNEGRTVPVWLREAETLIKQLEEIKLDSKVESDDKFLLMMCLCLCTRCFNCGEAQKKMKKAIALITEAKTFILPQAQSGGHSKTHERSWGEGLVRSSSTPAFLMISASNSFAIIDHQLEMEDAMALITGAKTFNLTLRGQAQSGGHSWAEVLVRSSSTPAIPMIIDDQLEMEENLLA